MFTIWSYFAKLQRTNKLLDQATAGGRRQSGEKVIVKQKLEVYDGTFDVWTSIRKSLVNWAFEIFLASNEPSVNRMR